MLCAETKYYLEEKGDVSDLFSLLYQQFFFNYHLSLLCALHWCATFFLYFSQSLIIFYYCNHLHLTALALRKSRAWSVILLK